MNHFTILFFAALLGSAIAQTASPAASPSASTSPSCNTLLLNATQPFDIFLLGEPANASASPSPSTSPAASGSPAASASPAASESPATSASPAPSSSPTLNLTNTLIGGTVAVNGDAVIVNSLLGSGLNCSSASPSPSSSPARSPSSTSSSPATSASPASSASPSPASANVTLLVTGNLNTTNSRVACDQSSLQAGANVTSSIDFESVRSQLLTTSRDLCGLPDTGIQANLSEAGALSLTLSANASELSVININANDLATLRFLRINASSSGNTTRRFVVINILGSTTTNLSANTTGIATTTPANATSSANATAGPEELLLRGFGMSLEGLNSSQLLWNFCNATNINVQFLRLMGSVLAPEARLRLSNAGHEGSIAVRSLEASFTSQNPSPFEGFFCPSASPSPSPSASPATTSPSPSP